MTWIDGFKSELRELLTPTMLEMESAMRKEGLSDEAIQRVFAAATEKILKDMTTGSRTDTQTT